MDYLVKKDKIRRFNVLQPERKRLFYKAMTMNQMISSAKRWSARVHLSRMGRRATATCIVNRCFITGRSRSVTRFCHLSRHEFRRLASGGFLPGVRKSSW
jgi:small subunit ribosomal protein S14